MKSIICVLLGHKETSHLDYIYGTLPREHRSCSRCGITLSFDRPTAARELELYKLGDVRDGAVGNCRPISV